MKKHEFDRHCNCFMCQAEKIKDRGRHERKLAIAKEFELKSNGIISKEDVLTALGGDYHKK